MAEFILEAKKKYDYNEEQALAMLLWHKQDLDAALQDLANWAPVPDQWSEEDKIMFQEAFQVHGKSFQKIRQEALPDKSTADLVEYYYSRSVQSSYSDSE